MSAVATVQGPPVSVLETVAGAEVVVTGRLDVHTVADVRLLLHAVLDRGQGDLMVHLAGAEVHDATGLGVLVGAHHRARRAGRRLVLVDVSPRLDRLLRGLPPAQGAGPAPRCLAGRVGRCVGSHRLRASPPQPPAATFGPWASRARPRRGGSATSRG